MITDRFVIDVSIKNDKTFNENSYPFNIPSIKNMGRLKFDPKVTFISGENGSGKSTLLEAISINMGFNPEGGSKNFHFKNRESHSILQKHITLAKSAIKPQDGYFFRAESFFNFATEIERLDEDPMSGPAIINAYGGVSLHEQSHGESFFSLMKNRFKGNSIFILDEPESALSPSRQMAMLKIIKDLTDKFSQFIIATHSPILLSFPSSTIYEFNSNGCKLIEYKETESYYTTRNFLNNPEKALSIIFDEG